MTNKSVYDNGDSLYVKYREKLPKIQASIHTYNDTCTFYTHTHIHTHTHTHTHIYIYIYIYIYIFIWVVKLETWF